MSADGEIFKAIGEGAALLAALDENAPDFFERLNRLREILAMLGAAAPAPAPLAVSLSDRDGTRAALAQYMQTGLAALPPELAGLEAQTVAELAAMASLPSLAQEALNWADSTQSAFPPNSEKTNLAALEHFKQRGIAQGMDTARLAENVRAGDALLKQAVQDDPDFIAATQRYNDVTRERIARARELEAAALELKDQYDGLLTSSSATEDERNAAFIRLENARRDHADYLESSAIEQKKAFDDRLAMRTRFNESKAAAHAALFEADGRAILAKLADASPVTDDAARAWAAEQVIDDNAKSKLKRLGYKPEDVVRDMAEFYRLTGGKASAIRISAGGKRANATGIFTRTGEKVINLGTHFNKTVLFHELAHHLENDPIAKAASNGFLLARREGDKVHRLRDLTGITGYGRDEVAWKDGFTDPYVGKVYNGGVTEVWSMGVQYLANPQQAAWFAGKDPEMFNLITGYLSAAATPAMHAKLNIHAAAISDAQDADEVLDQQYAKALAWLAARAPLQADDWYAKLLENPESNEARQVMYEVNYGRSKVSAYIGSNGMRRVFSGTFRNQTTKRNAKGYAILTLRPDGSFPDRAAVHDTLEVVQAMIAIADINGTSMSSTYYGYFHKGLISDPRQKVIDLVGKDNLQ